MHLWKDNRAVACAVWAASMLATTALPAGAGPILFGSNAYELVIVTDPFSGTNNSWETARDAAAASTYLGVSGHLATISSAEENAFLLSLVSTNYDTFVGAWLGGKAPEGWLLGPDAGAFVYTNWAGTEPNNAGYAYMNIGAAMGSILAGQWADDSFTQGVPDPTFDPVIGYFIEYEDVRDQAAVPEPASLLLVAAGLAGVARRVRRRR